MTDLRPCRVKGDGFLRQYQELWHTNSVLSAISTYPGTAKYKYNSHTNKVSNFGTDQTTKIAHYIRFSPGGAKDVYHDSFGFLRFVKPVDAAAYTSRIILRGAGASVSVQRPGTYPVGIIGEITVIVRHTLMSVSWDETLAGMTYDNPPVPDPSDPYVDVTIVLDESSGTSSQTSAIEFTGLGAKLYYGVKSEILSVTGGEMSVDCSEATAPESFSYIVYSDTYPGQACEYILPTLCTETECGGVEPIQYQDPAHPWCMIYGTLGVGTCSASCEEYELNGMWYTYWTVTCTQPFTVTSVVPFSSSLLKVDLATDCRVLLYGDQPRTEIAVASRTTASNVATLVTATPHGLSKLTSTSQPPAAIDGVDDRTYTVITHTSRTGGLLTITAPGHGLSAGNYVRIDGTLAQFSDATARYVYSVSGDTFRVASSGDAYATRSDSGVCWRRVYDTVGGSFTVVNSTTVRYSVTGPNEGTTPCTGAIYVM